MYALLDFGDLRIEQRTEHSKVKFHYKGKVIEDYKSYCDAKYLDSIENFLQGIIEKDAFVYCTKLTNVTIPDDITSISDYAFEGCKNLTSITIPDSVTNMGQNVFAYCTNLTSIEVPEGVTSIGKSAFYSCKSLTRIKIPDSVTSIGDYAFWNCTNLTSIEIPDGVTSIGENAFYKVKYVYYKGTATGSPWGAKKNNHSF